MTAVSRRSFIAIAGTATAAVTGLSVPKVRAQTPELGSLTKSAVPIAAEERLGRLSKVQRLMQQHRVGALLVEAGPTLDYFTGIQWWRSERTTAAVIPAEGGVVIVTPFFEEPSVRESLQVPGDVRTWKEDESPFDRLAGAVREHAGKGPVAVEATTRFFIVERLRQALRGSRDIVLGDDLVHPCREIKSPAQLALMQVANDVTLAAIRYVHDHVQVGMTAADVLRVLTDATTALGGMHEGTLVLLNEASAYPHGSIKPQQAAQAR